jgi:hypothetical protein
MLIARLVFMLAGLATCVCVAMYFWTRDRRYLRLAGRIFMTASGTGLVFFAILLLERLAML